MDFKHAVEILFAVLGAFVIGVAIVAIYRVLFAAGGLFDLSLNEIFNLIMDKIKLELQ